MRIGVLTDIHANREAMEAVLPALHDLAPDRIVLLGDVVGYGPDPEWASETVARLVADGAIALKGNHDEAAVTGSGAMSAHAAAAIRWTHARLGADHRAFLDQLPMTAEIEGALLVHASADRPAQWHYVIDANDAAACLTASAHELILCGHTHVPALFYALPGRRPVAFRPIDNTPAPLSAFRRHVAVIGAVGQPRDGNPCACFALLDMHARALTMHRVPYDAETTRRKIIDAGLPRELGDRLLIGR